MGFFADLHIHSKFSRATSRDCDLEHMAFWARKKGVGLIGTGDFTHPQWFQELEEKLVPSEPGLFRLRPDIEREVDGWLSGPSGEPVRFMLEVEISTIYKKDDRTRKVHHLIYAPDFEKAARFNERLGRIGNIASDGRPILGLDSRDLLEIALESGEGCYLIPAHIWTPWFSALGSKSGFDTIEHCYADLAEEIFAVETGLSSDPEMNRRLSRLDRFTLVSNSDAHSPPKIGREACAFDTDLDYFAILRALKTGEKYDGTVEFFAEEGKYHMDGHRKCGVCLEPEESRAHGGNCPVCNKPLTLGVMHRVAELADRPAAKSADLDGPPFRSLIPLDEVLSEIHGVGPKSKKVQRSYEEVVSRVGAELFVLDDAPVEDIERHTSPLFAEAIARMRRGEVIREPGFDGQYGTIRLFSKEEMESRSFGGRQLDLFPVPDVPKATKAPPSRSPGEKPTTSSKMRAAKKPKLEKPRRPQRSAPTNLTAASLLEDLDPDQRRAASHTEGPLVIIAGPGTGKTRTLTRRIAHLITAQGARPSECLAITFTRRAAEEMKQRIADLLGANADSVPIMTFHALGLTLLWDNAELAGLRPEFQVVDAARSVEMIATALSLSTREAQRMQAKISAARRQPSGASKDASNDDEIRKATHAYLAALREENCVDFDDLIVLPVQLFEVQSELRREYRERYRWLSVDEFQDVDALQYRLIRQIAPADGNICVIGDPDQSIYGFRGADVGLFRRFESDFPKAQRVALTRNYRSTPTIVDGALQMMAPDSLVPERKLVAQCAGPERIEIHSCASAKAEAELVVHTVERMIGGSTFFSLDSGRVESDEGESLAFGDFAVLYRTDAQAAVLVEAFGRSGMPYQKRSHGALADQKAVRLLTGAMAQLDKSTDTAVPVAVLLERAAEAVIAGGAETKDSTDENVGANLELYLPPLRELARRKAADLDGFMNDLALGIDADFWDPKAEGVSLLTLHAAKGLEFPVVFVVGCEDGVLPHRFGQDSDVDLAEERRLFFVGMTRARQRLFLTHARRRAWRGATRDMVRSPFVDAIEAELLRAEEHRREKPEASPYKQLTFF